MQQASRTFLITLTENKTKPKQIHSASDDGSLFDNDCQRANKKKQLQFHLLMSSVYALYKTLPKWALKCGGNRGRVGLKFLWIREELKNKHKYSGTPISSPGRAGTPHKKRLHDYCSSSKSISPWAFCCMKHGDLLPLVPISSWAISKPDKINFKQTQNFRLAILILWLCWESLNHYNTKSAVNSVKCLS